MSFQAYTADNATAAFDVARDVVARHLRTGATPVVLVPTPDAVARVRCALTQVQLAFGVRVETPPSWVADQWELFGDGRRIVEPAERALLVDRALRDVQRTPNALAATPGTVDLVSDLARDALPYLVGAHVPGAALGAGERAVVAALVRYGALLRSRGQCELSEAAHALAGAIDEPPPVVVLGFDVVGCAFLPLFDALAARSDVVRIDEACRVADDAPRASELSRLLDSLFTGEVGSALEPTGAVRFLLPAGRYAQGALVAREVIDAVRKSRGAVDACGAAPLPVCVVSRDPAALFRQVGDYLARRGIASALSAPTTFAATDFGHAFLALAFFACQDTYQVAQATDFALSMFSGMSQRNAYALDASWRADRMTDRQRIAHDLGEASEAAREVLSSLSAGDADGALAALEARLRRRGDLDAAYRAEQLAAVGTARRFAQACQAVHTPLSEMLPLLERAVVARSARKDARIAIAQQPLGDDARDPAPEPDVLFLTLDAASQRRSCSCSTLVLCDLSSDAYPVRSVENGVTLLVEKMGLGCTADTLAEARRRFFRVLSTARDGVVCERQLATVDADESYPAVMYEELLDCYRADPMRRDDVDHLTGLPFSLLPYAQTAGEDDLHGNLALGDDPSDVDAWDMPMDGYVSPVNRARLVVPRFAGDGDDDSPVLLSPSAIETYLACPCKWFSLRRLRLSEPDAGFGPLEMGSFSHGVLKSFYEHFIERGYGKVNHEKMPEARALLHETFERHLAFQSTLPPRRSPLIPVSSLEQTEVYDLKRKLDDYLERESMLLPGFVPTYFEYDFGSAEVFSYAGCALRGSIDRIDVNERGQAVVIDYKGSLSADYALASASPTPHAGCMMMPHKVQALIYAQVARRVLGLNVVGALYVSYGRDGRIAGAFDRTVLGEEAVPDAEVERCGVPGPAGEVLGVASFSEVIDRVEEGIAAAVVGLSGGFIAPEPRGSDPCGYCPVSACKERR